MRVGLNVREIKRKEEGGRKSERKRGGMNEKFRERVRETERGGWRE